MNNDTVVSYKCPSCGSALVFDAKSGKMRCRSCDSEFDVEVLEMLEATEGEQTGFDWSDYKKTFSGEPLENASVYICKSCGAEIVTDASTAATHCPYCDNEVVLTDRVEGGLKPNGIVPFKIDKKALSEKIAAFCKGKTLLPKNFFSESKIKDVQGVYVPFWLYDCRVDGAMTFDAKRIRCYSRGDWEYTETSYYLLLRDGGMNFVKVPVDGSLKMPDDLMDSVEPFDYSEIVDFDSAYLSGFLADRFDCDPEQSMPRAEERMKNSAADAFRDTARGYSSVTIRSNGMKITDTKIKYVLLPVYLLNCNYNGKKYQFAVNGQTGKVVGELPICKKKKRMWFWGVFAGVFALASLILYFLMRLGGAV